jgi:hypothetical protein
MKLSEAIRLGSMLKPQGFGILRNTELTACAMDAAFAAAGVKLGDDTWRWRDENWPILNAVIACPVCGEDGKALDFIISSHLNDTHRWTRERIADFVETIEPAQPAEGQTNEQQCGSRCTEEMAGAKR